MDSIKEQIFCNSKNWVQCFSLRVIRRFSCNIQTEKTLIPSNDACERIISFGKPRITKSFSKRQYFGNNNRGYLNITYTNLDS